MHDSTIQEQAIEADSIDPTTLPRDQRLAYWIERIQAWRLSGLSQTMFCRQENFVAHQFTYWLNKSQSMPEKNKASTHSIVPVTVAAAVSSQLQITLSNGIILTGITDQNLDLVQQFIQSL